MSLLAEVQAASRSRGPRCSVAVVRALLSDAEAADLDDLLADPAVERSVIARALTKRGHRMTGTTLSRHARGDCACPS